MLFFYILTIIFFYFAARFYYLSWKHQLLIHEIFGPEPGPDEFSCTQPKKESIQEKIIKVLKTKDEFKHVNEKTLQEKAMILARELEHRRIKALNSFMQFIGILIIYSLTLLGIIYVREIDTFYVLSAQLAAGIFLASAYFKSTLETKLKSLYERLQTEVSLHNSPTIKNTEKNLKFADIFYKVFGVLFIILLAKILFF